MATSENPEGLSTPEVKYRERIDLPESDGTCDLSPDNCRAVEFVVWLVFVLSAPDRRPPSSGTPTVSVPAVSVRSGKPMPVTSTNRRPGHARASEGILVTSGHEWARCIVRLSSSSYVVRPSPDPSRQRRHTVMRLLNAASSARTDGPRRPGHHLARPIRHPEVEPSHSPSVGYLTPGTLT